MKPPIDTKLKDKKSGIHMEEDWRSFPDTTGPTSCALRTDATMY